MLKRVFTAPDPGRTRLRFAARAVLGIGLAVVVCGLLGHSLTGVVTGGLAALLALFTVTDATVRGQAVTTALLPAVGLPVLAAAAALHDVPVARDLTFLAVVGLGVYARRWGPRGHSLGVFAFMTYFVAQFLHARPDQLPELYASVALSVLAAAVARFGLGCYRTLAQCSTLQGGGVGHPARSGPKGRGGMAEIALSDDGVVGPAAGRAGSQACGGRAGPTLTGRRWPVKQEPEVVPRSGTDRNLLPSGRRGRQERRLPPPVVPAPPAGTGLARVTTRQAVQATAGAGFALVVGQLVSGERWYWAVGATWWVFVNTTSRGETLVRGFRRVLGTVIGIGPALLVAVPAHGEALPTALVAAVCVFGIFYTAAVSYTWMMLWVTVLAAMLYGLLGVLSPALLALRLLETGVGALGAVLAVVFVLPVTTHRVTDGWIQRALRCVHACTAEAAARLAGTAGADPAPMVAELEELLARVRLSVAPLVHPLNPVLGRKRRARRVLALLDDCAREVRGLVAVAADPEASHDARLAAACWRVEAAVEALTGGRDIAVRAAPAASEPALAHLHGLERSLAELSAPLRTPSRSPLVGA